MKKKALFIGGTGTISTAVVRRLVNELDWEVWVLNRGHRAHVLPEGVHQIIADINDEKAVAEKLGDMTFDAVCEFIGFHVSQVERDYRLFAGRTKQYIYISSASAYNKPAAGYIITEGTTLANPYWQYSRDKIACEEFLMRKYREEGFPVTIVRPSHTYDERNLPLGVHGKNGPWQVIRRMQQGKPVIIQGDGSSLWTLTWNADALGVKLNAYHVSTDFLRAAGDRYGYDFTGSLLGDKSVSVVFDNTKLKRVVPDMRTNVRFDMGVRFTLDYVLSHPAECQKEDPEFDAWCDRVIAILEEAKSHV